MKINIVKTPRAGAYLVYPVFEKAKAETTERVVKSFLAENKEFGKLYETQILFDGDKRILLVGLGKKEEVDFEKLQNWAGTAAKALMFLAKEAVLVIPKVDVANLGESVAIGVELAAHDPAREYKTEKQPDVILKEIGVLGTDTDKDTEKGLARGVIIAEAINLARRLGDMPANEMTPTYFLNVARKVARVGRMKFTFLTEAQAKRKGMGAFCAVSKGSDEPSYMIALEYKGDPKSKEKWGFVGKGVTFDSGGISIKPGEGMHEMKYDMSGAGAVLAAMQAISKLKPKVNVVGVMAVTENLPGGRSLKPGDIVRTYCGKTAEILNTDAEGRVVLVDAVSWAQKDFAATKLVDLATLTGAMIIALGSVRAGLFGNNPKFSQEVITAAARVGEKVWEMPMDKEYNEMIKSEIADIANLGQGPHMGNREAGSITGAKFIEAVVDAKNPWVHLDIAGVSWDTKPKPYRCAGSTGFGVKTLLKLVTANGEDEKHR